MHYTKKTLLLAFKNNLSLNFGDTIKYCDEPSFKNIENNETNSTITDLNNLKIDCKENEYWIIEAESILKKWLTLKSPLSDLMKLMSTSFSGDIDKKNKKQSIIENVFKSVLLNQKIPMALLDNPEKKFGHIKVRWREIIFWEGFSSIKYTDSIPNNSSHNYIVWATENWIKAKDIYSNFLIMTIPSGAEFYYNNSYYGTIWDIIGRLKSNISSELELKQYNSIKTIAEIKRILLAPRHLPSTKGFSIIEKHDIIEKIFNIESNYRDSNYFISENLYLYDIDDDKIYLNIKGKNGGWIKLINISIFKTIDELKETLKSWDYKKILSELKDKDKHNYKVALDILNKEKYNF